MTTCKMINKDIVVVGAGAAGLTAAIFAALQSSPETKIAIIERTDKAGKKILMSGGTRCNVLPVSMSEKDYFTDSSIHLLKRIFKSWSVEGCKNWFIDDLQLPLACEVETNKWFPVTNSAKDVRDALLNKALSLNVEIHYSTQITEMQHNHNDWILTASDAKQYQAKHVIWSTGGLSVPTIGTDGAGHQVLRSLGVQMKPTYPALTPLTGQHPGSSNLAGVSLTVGLTADTMIASREGFLFTHKGFSGPSVLDVSHCVTRYVMGQQQRPELAINWTGESKDIWQKRLTTGKSTVLGTLKEYIPNRLAEALTEGKSYRNQKVSELSKNDRADLIQLVTAYSLSWSSHEGYRKAEVTGGGVPLEAIDTATMRLKNDPGLFLCGEIMDVFGRIGGFNFYWAWVTGRLAGLAASKLPAQQQAQEV
ncbi:MAG: aminoacetone oxidase family FAD-binding enzyme [Balneolales bacterium]|nr:aminoacetone oxidase family FAD-binding enzyme [Balneolales bacterium]